MVLLCHSVNFIHYFIFRTLFTSPLGGWITFKIVNDFSLVESCTNLPPRKTDCLIETWNQCVILVDPREFIGLHGVLLFSLRDSLPGSVVIKSVLVRLHLGNGRGFFDSVPCPVNLPSNSLSSPL